MESCKKRALIIGGGLLVIALLALIAGIALTNTSSSRSETRTRTVVDRCKLPMVVGPCKALILSWYFDGQTGDCEQFGYGGCGGNENRFSSKEECRDACVTTDGESVEDF